MQRCTMKFTNTIATPHFTTHALQTPSPKVRHEAYDTIDTSTWAQAEREKYDAMCAATDAALKQHEKDLKQHAGNTRRSKSSTPAARPPPAVGRAPSVGPPLKAPMATKPAGPPPDVGRAPSVGPPLKAPPPQSPLPVKARPVPKAILKAFPGPKATLTVSPLP